MKIISASQTTVLKLARDFGLLNFPHSLHRADVAVNQFTHGNQGFVRQVATYNGSILEVTMPVSHGSDCAVLPIHLETKRFIAIAGLLYEIDAAHGYVEHTCKWDVALCSSASLVSQSEVLQAAIDKLDAQIADILAQKAALLNKMPVAKK
jgi:hypothetical protein